MRQIRYGLTSALLLAACTSGGSTSSDFVTQALTNATSTHQTVKQCFADFDACVAAAGTDTAALTACKDTLGACLPTPPTPPGLPDLCESDDGGVEPPHGQCNGDGGPPKDGPGGPPKDGPGGPPKDGPGDHGKGGPGGGDPHGPPLSPSGHLAVATCHAQLKACLAAGTDPATCIASDHQCVHDALVADFAQLCADAAARCAACATPSGICDKIATQCAAGLPLGDLPDGGPAHP